MVLKGIRVLDFGRYIAGPYCAALLGDYGADVIRIERREGGEDRSIPALAESGEGGLFLQMNRNKRCLTLDLASEEGREVVRKLVASADIVVANLPPATLKNLGLDYPTLSELNPRIILALVTAYGSGGPYSERVGFDSVGQAMSGAMYMSGHPGKPSRASVNYVDFATAQACAMGILAALLARAESGRGQLVEGSLLRSALVLTNALLIEEAVTDRGRIPQGNRGLTAAPVDIYHCLDGAIVVHTVGAAMFRRWCKLMGREDLTDDPRMRTDEMRGDCGAEISGIMADWCGKRERGAALETLSAAKIPCAPIYALKETLADPHIAATGMLPAMSFPGLPRAFPLVPHPVTLSATPTVSPMRAPLLAEHTDEIMGELGYSSEEIARLRHERVI